jgi:hypothetical protein
MKVAKPLRKLQLRAGKKAAPWEQLRSSSVLSTSVPGKVAEQAQESLEYYVDLSLAGEREGNWLKTWAGRIGGGLSALGTKENIDKTVLTLGGAYIAAPALATTGPVMTWAMAGKGALNTTIDAGIQLATKGKIDDYGSLVRSFAVGAASVPAADKLLPVISKMPVVGQIVTQAATKMPIATQVATSAIANGFVGGGSQIVGNVATGKEWHDQVLETAAMDALFGGGGEALKYVGKGAWKLGTGLANKGGAIADDILKTAGSKIKPLVDDVQRLVSKGTAIADDFRKSSSGLISDFYSPSTLTNVDNWLASGAQGGLRRKLGAVRLNNFRKNSTIFYSVQDDKDVLRLISGGKPWPSGMKSANMGEGLYTWSSKSNADSYLELLKNSAIKNNYPLDALNTMSFRISNKSLSGLRVLVPFGLEALSLV